MIRFKLFISLSLCIICNPILAQSIEENIEVRTFLDNMFMHIDKSKIKTGLLRDYAFDLVDFEKYDGTQLTDSNYVERFTFENILRSVRSAAVTNKPFKEVNSIIDNLSHSPDNTIKISTLLYKYNYIQENALRDNLIKFENNQVYDRFSETGEWINPYDEKYIFAFSAFNKVEFTPNVKFTFPHEYFFTNENIKRILFDCGDGSGLQEITKGGTISASYTEGIKEIRMHITLNSGSVLRAHCKIKIEANNVEILKKDQYTQPIEFANGNTKAYVTVLHSSENKTKTIIRPFIIAEGFDPVLLTEFFPPKYNSPKNFNPKIFGYTNAYQLLDIFKDLSDEYDLIYIDWINSETDIKHNALLMEKIIKWVNEQKKQSGSNHKNIVMGISMGGLIARYALRKMELNGIPHETSTYISGDAPHLGANIPLGYLYATHALLSFYYGGSKAINILNSKIHTDGFINILQHYLYSQSAKQMLVNYIDESGNLDNTTHNEWQQTLNEIGFPNGDNNSLITNLAFINGGLSQDIPPKHLLTINAKATSGLLFSLFGIILEPIADYLLGIQKNFFSYIIPGKTTLSLNTEVNPYISNGEKLLSVSLTYRKKFLWLVNSKRHTIFEYHAYAPTYGLPYDNFPGSYFTLNDFQPENNESDGNIFLGKYNFDYKIANKFTFIPSMSALCFGYGKKELTSADYCRSIYPIRPSSAREIPFHSILNDEYASLHTNTSFSNENVFSWLKKQIEMQIDGPSVPISGDTYRIRNCNIPIIWSIVDPEIANINPSTGKITILKNGFTSVQAECTINGIKYVITKHIMSGLPAFTLDFKYDRLLGYITTANCQEHEFSFFLNSGEINYEWGLKSGQSDIVWKETKDSVFVIGALDNLEPKTVFMRIKNIGGYIGKTYNYTVSPQYPLGFQPEYIVTNKLKEVYSCSHNMYPQQATNNNLPLNLFVYYKKKYEWDRPQEPYRIIINDENTHYYYEYSYQQDYNVGITFPMFTQNEFMSYLEQIKPWGNKDIIKFNITVQNSKREDIQTSPVFLIYLDNFPEQYFNGEIDFSYWVPSLN